MVYTRSEYIPLRAVKVYTFFPETQTKHSRLPSADQINCLSGCGGLSFDVREVTCFNMGDDAAAGQDDDDFTPAMPAKRAVVGTSLAARKMMRPASTGAAVLAGTRGGLWPSIVWHCETLLPQGASFVSANVSCERAPPPNSRTHVLRGSCRIYYELAFDAPTSFSLQSFFEAAKSGKAPVELQNILGAVMNGGQLRVEQGSGKVSVVEPQPADTPAPTVEVVSSTADAAGAPPPARKRSEPAPSEGGAAEDEPPAGESSASESPIWGAAYMQGGLLGLASYHFRGPDDCYISYEAAPPDWLLDDGTRPPAVKRFESPSWDADTRTFVGAIDWSAAPFGGDARWEYTIVFSEDFATVAGGEVRAFDAAGARRRHRTRRFGRDLHYELYVEDRDDATRGPPDVATSDGQGASDAASGGSALRALLDLKQKMRRRRTWGEAEA